MTEGKIQFKKFRVAIRLLSRLLAILPRPVQNAIFIGCNAMPGSVFVLIRYCLLKNLCHRMGENVYIARNVMLKNVGEIKIGDNVSIHEFCYLDGWGGITIGSDVSVAHGSSIISFNHTYGDTDLPIKYNESRPAPVVIGDDVWIGCGVRVLGNTTIASRSILAAGCVASGTYSGGAIYGGIIAKEIKKIY